MYACISTGNTCGVPGGDSGIVGVLTAVSFVRSVEFSLERRGCFICLFERDNVAFLRTRRRFAEDLLSEGCTMLRNCKAPEAANENQYQSDGFRT